MVRLPLALPPTRTRSSQAQGEIIPFLRQDLRILVVEDNADSAESLAILLRSRGVSVHTAHTGLNALQLADTIRPDVVLLDIGLPDMSGYEVAQQLRNRSWAGMLRVVAISGWAAEADRRRSDHSGIDLHLAKPVDPQELLAFLDEADPAESDDGT